MKLHEVMATNKWFSRPEWDIDTKVLPDGHEIRRSHLASSEYSWEEASWRADEVLADDFYLCEDRNMFLTIEDVGKLVKLRNGTIALITSGKEDRVYAAGCGFNSQGKYLYHVSNDTNPDYDSRDFDIIEILD